MNKMSCICVPWSAYVLQVSMLSMQDSTSRILHHDTIYLVNIVVGSILACQLLRSVIWLTFVVIRTWQSKRIWKRRRLRNVVLFSVEISAQLVGNWLIQAVAPFLIQDEACLIAAYICGAKTPPTTLFLLLKRHSGPSQQQRTDLKLLNLSLNSCRSACKCQFPFASWCLADCRLWPRTLHRCLCPL